MQARISATDQTANLYQEGCVIWSNLSVCVSVCMWMCVLHWRGWAMRGHADIVVDNSSEVKAT